MAKQDERLPERKVERTKRESSFQRLGITACMSSIMCTVYVCLALPCGPISECASVSFQVSLYLCLRLCLRLRLCRSLDYVTLYLCLHNNNLCLCLSVSIYLCLHLCPCISVSISRYIYLCIDSFVSISLSLYITQSMF